MTRPDPTSPLSCEALLEQSDWLRRLAGVLVRDPGAADDLVQETWLAALRRAPAGDREARGWLATVARNAARRGRRDASRRAERELAAARSEAVPAAEEVVARAALSRRVVGAVLALDEPYRSTLLLRYFEDLPPR